MILPPGVRYSILRNNVEVPLIPADQLPFYIQGLPRELTPIRSHQEGWKSIGETQQPAIPLSIRAPSDLQSSQLSYTSRRFLPPDHDARKDLITTSQVSRPLAEARPALIAPAEIAVGHLVGRSLVGHPASTTTERFTATRSEEIQCPSYRFSHPSGIEPDSSKKEYCTHWIRTDSCDFMQQGCKYKHEMPDREKLRELGFAEIPKWYRDKTAISAGASSWLRPRPAQDDKGRSLSVESPASRAFRPSMSAGRSQPRAAELSGLLAPKAGQVPVEMPNLIDLDDSSIARVSLTPSLSIGSTSGAASFNAKAIVAQPSEHVIKTLASSLRQEELNAKKYMNAPLNVGVFTTDQSSGRQGSDDAPLVADLGLAKDNIDSLSQTLSQSRASDLDNCQEVRQKNSSASETIKWGRSIARSSAAPGPGGKYNSKSSEPQQKRDPRPRKLAERVAASANREGLASSQHATGRKPREVDTPSKGRKRGSIHGGGKDLCSEIVHRQRAVHKQEQFSKGASSNGFQPWTATGQIEAA